jgi:hypothetical protein
MAANRPGVKDASLTFEIETVSGEGAKQLRDEQARAIRDLLVWVREQRSSHEPLEPRPRSH